MPYSIVITARAFADAEKAVSWLQERSPQAAARWLSSLMEKIQSLEDDAHCYASAAEADALGVDLREMLFGKRRNMYRVLFTIEAGIVNVLHLRHRAQDLLKPEDF